ncbi:hypothetical protein ACLGIH_01345 [Streptomyces sp. HMX87]|uniref:hypothetical protein n=1 Tax=Streptomyces sp. HMX87 TaxID=3390849 RepID=UPI003A89E09C
MRRTLRRLVTAMTCALAVTLLALTTAVVSEVSAPTTAHASSVGGSISRNEVLNRAKWWIDNYGVIYSQSMADAKPSVTGEKYRPDCSGFVSMAWRLPKVSGNDRWTGNLNSFGDTATFSNLDNLQPGDAILGKDAGHVALFHRWTDSSKTSMQVYEEYDWGKAGRHATHTKSYYENAGFAGVRYDEIVNSTGPAVVYGAMSDGRLTYTRLDTETGKRTHGAVTSTAKLGFTPKAMATLNFNTVLVTSTAGHLYRVDIITNNTSLSFSKPVDLGKGWTHDLLTYDGSGHLFGIADGTLRRYNIGAAKPSASHITGNTIIDTGFTLKTLGSTGPDWLLGTTSAGKLLSYRIDGAGDWTRYELKSSTWQVMDALITPGGGAFYGHRAEGSMHAYVDTLPYNGSGADLRGTGTVDSSGWTQTLLSAQPRTAA